MDTIKFRGKDYEYNPLTTDFHVGCIAKSLSRDDGYVTIDGFNQICKQLVFIFPNCDFAVYDVNTRDGLLDLQVSELIEILSILKDKVNTDEEAIKDVVQVTDELHKLQEQLESLKAKVS